MLPRDAPVRVADAVTDHAPAQFQTEAAPAVLHVRLEDLADVAIIHAGILAPALAPSS
jgi:hypothetical protein